MLGSMASASPKRRRRAILISVAGNIGVGKSTYMILLDGMIKGIKHVVQPAGMKPAWLLPLFTDDCDVRTAPEPIEKFQPSLEEYYKDMPKNAFMLQIDTLSQRLLNYVLRHEVHGTHECCTDADAGTVLVLTERGLHEDMHVFADHAIATGNMSKRQAEVYHNLATLLAGAFPSYDPIAYVYLRAEPEVCFQRKLQRKRECEATVDIAYLRALHARYEALMEKLAGEDKETIVINRTPDDPAAGASAHALHTAAFNAGVSIACGRDPEDDSTTTPVVRECVRILKFAAAQVRKQLA